MADQGDRQGQAPRIAISAPRLTDRAIDELVGLCKGTLADGIVTQEEAQFIANWIEANRHAADVWPANVLYKRIREMLEDGHLDPNEQAELLDLIADATGGGLAPTPEDASGSTALPLCDPPPSVEFEGRVFCLTGKFVSGKRSDLQAAVEIAGGICKSSPSRTTDFLVIGEIGSRDWIHSTHGRKIEKAVTLRDEQGTGISIVSEQAWADALLIVLDEGEAP